MTVCFANAGHLDLDMVRIMGLSVKETDSPIGYFGTGLKFSIATLLRTGHRVRLWTGGEWHDFGVEQRTIRGQEVSVVRMGSESLPFTLQLGRNWEVWQAYRELASNARDEPDCLVTSSPIDPERYDTCICVTGEEIERAHRERADIFCEGRVLHRIEGVAEVREGMSSHVFYRGVRVHTLREPSMWTWNFLSECELTEDRTLKYLFQTDMPMAQLVSQSDDAEFVRAVVSAHDQQFEHRADFSYVTSGSETFMEVTRHLTAQGQAQASAARLWARQAPDSDVYEDAVLDEEDRKTIHEAEQLCLAIDPDYLLEPRYVVTLGDSRYGMVRSGRVYIAHSTISMGTDFLAATLMEEYLHKQHGFADMSRGLQNHLFQQLVRLARRLP